VITEGVEVPESNNELRKMQLRELALLNGTLREDISMVRYGKFFRYIYQWVF
jgi:splicing factor 1